jgi:hypothetical protein
MRSKSACNISTFVRFQPVPPGETFFGLIQTRFPCGGLWDAGDDFATSCWIRTLLPFLRGGTSLPVVIQSGMAAPSIAGPRSQFDFLTAGMQ